MAIDKIIARELPPESIDFSNYFATDAFSGDYILYIPGTRNTSGLNAWDFDRIADRAQAIVDEFDNPHTSYKQIMLDYDIPYTPQRCAKLKAWAARADTARYDHIAEFLTITTGQQWATDYFTGYSQGDFCTVVYRPDQYTPDAITEIGKLWLGCGTEFLIDDVGGFFVIDTVRWQEGAALRKALADAYGCRSEDLIIELYTGETRTVTHNYKTMED